MSNVKFTKQELKKFLAHYTAEKKELERKLNHTNEMLAKLSGDVVISKENAPVFRADTFIVNNDLDDTILVEPILNPGDASFTLEGGHNYEILEDNTLVYEYKTGPYEGQALDKTFIGE